MAGAAWFGFWVPYNGLVSRRDLEEWFWQLDESLRRLTEAVLVSPPALASRKCWQPRVDLTEDALGFRLTAELSGARSRDCEAVYLPDRHSVLIRGFREDSRPAAGEGRTRVHQLEIFYGEFEREVRLPEVPVDALGIRFESRDGFLHVWIPKAREAMRQSRVTIRRV